tara:strand:+ start:10356 stop:10640 length:285 start_codon:yes stop_codon:yes gene_type:complete
MEYTVDKFIAKFNQDELSLLSKLVDAYWLCNSGDTGNNGLKANLVGEGCNAISQAMKAVIKDDELYWEWVNCEFEVTWAVRDYRQDGTPVEKGE